MTRKNNVFAAGLFFIGLVFALSFTVSCGGKTEKQKVVLTVQAEQGWMPYYKEAVKRVEETHPNTEIKLIEVGAFDHLDRLDATDASNKDVADLFAIPADRLYGLAENEALASIDSKKISSELGGWSNFDLGLGGNLKIGNEYLAFPLNYRNTHYLCKYSKCKSTRCRLYQTLRTCKSKRSCNRFIASF